VTEAIEEEETDGRWMNVNLTEIIQTSNRAKEDPNFQWEYMNSDGFWLKYDDYSQQAIEKGWRAGVEQVVLNHAWAAKDTYTILFKGVVSVIQKNNLTGRWRYVRRIVGGDRTTLPNGTRKTGAPTLQPGFSGSMLPAFLPDYGMDPIESAGIIKQPGTQPKPVWDASQLSNLLESLSVGESIGNSLQKTPVKAVSAPVLAAVPVSYPAAVHAVVAEQLETLLETEEIEEDWEKPEKSTFSSSTNPRRSVQKTYQESREQFSTLETPPSEEIPQEMQNIKITLTGTTSETSLDINDVDEIEIVEPEQEDHTTQVSEGLTIPKFFPALPFSPVHVSPEKSYKPPSQTPILGSSRSQDDHRVPLELGSSSPQNKQKKKDQEREKTLDIGEWNDKSDPQSNIANPAPLAEVKITTYDSPKKESASVANENILPAFDHLKDTLTIPIAPIEGTAKLNVVLEQVLTNDYQVPRRSRTVPISPRSNKSNVQIVAELARLESEVDEEIKILMSTIEDKDQLDAEMELKKRLALIEEQLGQEFSDLEEKN